MKKTVIALCLVSAMILPLGSAVALGYADIKGHWAEETILENNFTDIFSGQQSFLPDQAITRIEFACMLHSAVGFNVQYFRAPDIREYFGDMQNDSPGAIELYELVSVDIIPKADAFRPNDPLRRDDLIHYVIKALDYKTDGEYPLIRMLPIPFADDAEIPPAYKNDVITAVLLGIINGRGNNMLYPAFSATRAEAVTVISRLLATLKNVARVDVYVEAAPYADSMEMTLSIANNTKDPVTIHSNSAQSFDFQLFDADGVSLYRWSADKMFTMVLTSSVIEPGETQIHTVTLDRDIYQAIKNRIYSMKAYIIGTSDSFNVNAAGYEYLP